MYYVCDYVYMYVTSGLTTRAWAIFQGRVGLFLKTTDSSSLDSHQLSVASQ